MKKMDKVDEVYEKYGDYEVIVSHEPKEPSLQSLTKTLLSSRMDTKSRGLDQVIQKFISFLDIEYLMSLNYFDH
jgi:hypothetical protein